MIDSLPQHQAEPQHQVEIPLCKLKTKFVQGLKEYGTVVRMPSGNYYYAFPHVVLKPVSSPVGVYAVFDFKDMPDEFLSTFGLQRIPAKTEENGTEIQEG